MIYRSKRVSNTYSEATESSQGILKGKLNTEEKIQTVSWTATSHCTRHIELERGTPETLNISGVGVLTALPPVVVPSVGGGTQVREAGRR